MRSFVWRNRTLIVLAAVLAVVGGLWWTRTTDFSKTAVVAFSPDSPFTPWPENEQDTSPGILIRMRFTAEDVWEVADRVAETYGGSGADYESDLSITNASEIAGMVVTAHGRTPSSAQRLANYGAFALSDLINEKTLTSTGKPNATSVQATE